MIDTSGRALGAEGSEADVLWFRKLTESLPHLVWSAAADGVPNYFNARFLSYLGRTMAEMQGWSWAEALHPDDRQRSSEAWEAASGVAMEYCIDCRIRRADGAYRWHEMRAAPLRNAAGTVVRWVGTCTDIEERKKATAELGRYRELFQLVSEMVVMADRDGLLTTVNPAFMQTLGFSEAEIRGKPYIELVHPDDRQRTLVEVTKQVQGSWELKDFENRYMCKDGSTRLFSWNAYYKEEDQLFFGLARDVTEQKQTETSLRESEEKFRALSEAMPQMVWASDRDGRADYFNSRWFSYTGQTFEEARNLGWLHTLHPDDVPRAQDRWTHAVTTGEAYEVEYRIRARDGSYRWFLSRGVAKRGIAAQIERWIGTCTDIGAQKALEETLNLARDAAEEAMLAKTQFLANVSHEIRTPITVFTTAIELLLTQGLPPEQQELLEMADASANRLRNLVEDILDLSRYESGKMEIGKLVFDIRACVQEAVELFSLPAREKKLSLTLAVAPDVPATMIGDPGRLGQVIVNLVGNAIKFTHQGSVEVSLRLREGRLEVAVTDTGIGIPKNKFPLLFQSFSQVDTSLARRYEGSGLGLAISRGLVEIMGGEIQVQSREGEGSIFSFTIPLQPAADPYPVTVSEVQLPG